MRHILRQRELVPDPWRYLGEEVAAGDALIVPLAELKKDPEHWYAWSGRLGVRLSPVDRVEELVPMLPHLDLIAVEFPSPGEGRGYTQGRLLRERFEFHAELRAYGAGVKQDLVFLLARCGFDALQLAPGEDAAAAQVAFNRYDVAYQPGAAEVSLRRQRFFSA